MEFLREGGVSGGGGGILNPQDSLALPRAAWQALALPPQGPLKVPKRLLASLSSPAFQDLKSLAPGLFGTPQSEFPKVSFKYRVYRGFSELLKTLFLKLP